MRQLSRSLTLVFAMVVGVVVFPSALLAAEKTAVIQVETAHEKLVRRVASKLRCPVCQGESVYDSHAEVAVEMKNLISDKLAAGASEADVLTYFQERYGNYILMAPPTSGVHWVIWVFPIFMGLMGVVFLYQHIKSSSRETKRQIDPGTNDSADDGFNDSSDRIEELHL